MTHSTFFKQALPCIIVAFLALFATISEAQTSTAGVNSDGRDFYIGSVYPSFNKNPNNSPKGATNFYKSYALISSYQDSKVRLSYFDPQSGVEVLGQTFFIPARTTIQIPLDSSHTRLSDTGDIPEYKSCHITADAPVNVQFFSTGANSGGSYLGLATNGLGKNYIIPTYNDNPGYGAATNSGSKGENAGGFFEIIASFDKTSVTITPNGSTAGGHVGTNTGKGAKGTPHPYSVTLSRGQCYFVKGWGDDDGNDMSGSVVTSDKPVAVLAGHEDAFIGDVGARYLDARDFMIEELIPAEAWDTTGYVSMPLKDPVGVAPEESGAGENYRAFANNPKSALVDMWLGSDAYPMYTSKYSYPLPEKDNITDAVEFRSENGEKFGVMLYDNRAQGNAPPYPAESMMGIIPMSRWKTSYMIYVPSNPNIVLQSYYINLIALRNDIDRSNIKYSHNGGALVPLTGLSAKGSYLNFPHHPELKGVRYAVAPGSYCFTNTRDAYKNPLSETGPNLATFDQVAADTGILHGGFMIYNYGFRAIASEGGTLGTFDGTNFFFSYANPAGASLWSGDGGKFSVTIDSQCGKWHVCVQDNRASDAGIRSVTMLNDLNGVQFYPAKQSVNALLDPVFDLSNSGDVQLPGTASSICFDVLVNHPIDPADAAVLITDNAGNLKLVELKYAPVKLVVTPSSSPINFSNSGTGADTCTSISIKNSGSTSQVIANATVGGGSGFSLTSNPLPVTLQPGDSLVLKVCFSLKDTAIAHDTVRIQFGCLTQEIALVGKGATGLISATDIDFGKVKITHTATDSVTITNVGSRPFALTSGWTMTGSKAFSFTPPAVPDTIQPGTARVVYVDYSPGVTRKDTAIIHWATNIDAPFTQSVKSYTVLSGEGIPLNSSIEAVPATTLSIHPNPASGMSIILSLGSANNEMAEIHIFDLLGREMYKKILLPEGKESQLEIPISNLQNGIYYARVTMGGKTVTEKFEVMR